MLAGAGCGVSATSEKCLGPALAGATAGVVAQKYQVQVLVLITAGRRMEESRGHCWWRPSCSRLVPPNSSGSMGLGGFCAAWWMLSPWKRWIFVTSRMRTLSGILLGLIKNLCYFHCVRGLKPARKFVLKVLTPRKPPQTNSHVIKVAQYEGRVRGLSRRPHGDNSVAAWSATLCLGLSTGAVPRLLPLCDLCK